MHELPSVLPPDPAMRGNYGRFGFGINEESKKKET